MPFLCTPMEHALTSIYISYHNSYHTEYNYLPVSCINCRLYKGRSCVTYYPYILGHKCRTHVRPSCWNESEVAYSVFTVSTGWILSKHGKHKPSVKLKEFLRAKKVEKGKVSEKMGRGIAVKLKTLASSSLTLFKRMTCLYPFLEAPLGKGVVTDFPKATTNQELLQCLLL